MKRIVDYLESERFEDVAPWVRKSGFTVAPEAATERMRRVINKGNAEKDLLHAVDTVFGAGWDLVKFYFMIGLPAERDEDVRAIVKLSADALRRGKKSNPRAEINVGVSTFCPKSFTPYQWDPMIPLEETQRKHALLREELRRLGRGYRDLHVKPHDARQSALEGALALGDRRLATAVLSSRASIETRRARLPRRSAVMESGCASSPTARRASARRCPSITSTAR